MDNQYACIIISLLFLNISGGIVYALDEMKDEPIPPSRGQATLEIDKKEYYIGERMQLNFSIGSGYQPIRYEISDPDGIVASSGQFDLGSRPYDADSGTVALWRMDRIDIMNITPDSSGKKNHGRVNGGSCHEGEFENAISSFNYVEVFTSDTLNITGKKLSIELWVKVPSSSPDTRMILFDKEESYQIELRPNREICWALMTSDMEWYLVRTGITLPLDEWVYIAFTYDGEYGRTYLNGQLQDTKPYSYGNIRSSRLPLGIGGGLKWSPGWQWSYPLHGSLDEVRLSNVCRSPHDIMRAFYSINSSYRVSHIDIGDEYQPGVYRISSWSGMRQLDDIYVDVMDPTPEDVLNLYSVPGDGFIELGWEGVESETLPILGYSIYRGIKEDELSLIERINHTSYNDTGLDNGRVYHYRICTYNKFRESGGIHISERPRTHPDPPSNISIRWGDRFIEIFWSPPASDGGDPISEYLIFKGLSDYDFFKHFSVSSYFNSFNDSSVVNGQTYYYRIHSVNSVGVSYSFALINATPISIPSPPTVLIATPDDESVHLEWDYPLNNGGSVIEGYSIYRRMCGDDFQLIQIINGSYYHDVGLTNGISYSYYLTSRNVMGESIASKTVKVIPGRVPDPPSRVIFKRGNGFINLSWSVPANGGGVPLLGFIITRYSISTETLESYEIDPSESWFNDKNVIRGCRYRYSIQAWNERGYSIPSEAVEATAAVIPNQPENLRIDSGDCSILLEWYPPSDDGSDGISAYRVYRIHEGNSKLLAILSGDVTSFNDIGLENGIEYNYMITAMNGIGESKNAATGMAIPATCPGPVTGLKAITNERIIQLFWDHPTDNGGMMVDSFLIFRSMDGEDELLLDEIDRKYSSYNDTQVKPEIKYRYRIVATNRIGPGMDSESVEAMIKEDKTLSPNLYFIFLMLTLMTLIIIISLIFFIRRRMILGANNSSGVNVITNGEKGMYYPAPVSASIETTVMETHILKNLPGPMPLSEELNAENEIITGAVSNPEDSIA